MSNPSRKHKVGYRDKSKLYETPRFLRLTLSTGNHRLHRMDAQHQQMALASAAIIEEYLRVLDIEADVYAIGHGAFLKFEVVFRDTGARLTTPEFGSHVLWAEPKKLSAMGVDVARNIVDAYTASAAMNQPKQ